MRVKWAVVVVALCVVVTVAAVAYAAGKATGEVPEVVRAQRFEVVDAEGKTLAVLGLEGLGNPSLTLLDRRGTPRVQLSHQPDAFRGVPGGLGGPSSLVMLNDNGEQALRLEVLFDSPTVSLNDRHGKTRVMLAFHPGAPSVGVYEADGETLTWHAP